MGLSAGPAEGSAGHQFPLRGVAFPGRPLSRAGIAFLRVHWHEVAQDKMKIHQGR
jgi:hypothetical protein